MARRWRRGGGGKEELACYGVTPGGAAGTVARQRCRAAGAAASGQMAAADGRAVPSYTGSRDSSRSNTPAPPRYLDRCTWACSGAVGTHVDRLRGQG